MLIPLARIVTFTNEVKCYERSEKNASEAAILTKPTVDEHKNQCVCFCSVPMYFFLKKKSSGRVMLTEITEQRVLDSVYSLCC